MQDAHKDLDQDNVVEQVEQDHQDPGARASVREVELETPIERGTSAPITRLTLRRPDAGSLRGLSLMDLAQLDVTALQRLLPRIASPMITAADVRKLDPADLFSLGAEVAGFLLKKQDLQDFQGR